MTLIMKIIIIMIILMAITAIMTIIERKGKGCLSLGTHCALFLVGICTWLQMLGVKRDMIALTLPTLCPAQTGPT